MAIRLPYYEVRVGDDLGDPEYWNRRFENLDLRLHGQELIEKDWQAAVRELQNNGIKRIDDAISPLLKQLEQDAQLGALFISESTSTLEVKTGTLTLGITSANKKRFAPAAYVALISRDAPYIVMLGRLVNYNRETAALTLDIERIHGGNPNELRQHWVVSATAHPSHDYHTDAIWRTAGNGLASTKLEDALVEILALTAPKSRSITAGTGLTGGGDLSANRTISLDLAYSDVRYVLAADYDAHRHPFSEIDELPTTLAGHGINNAYTKDEINTQMANKSNNGHVHTIANVTGLQNALDAKLDDSQATDFGLSLLDDADAAAARTTLGLGSLATKSTVATTDITNANVTNAKLANMAQNTFKGRKTASSGSPEDLTVADVKTILALSSADISDLTTLLAGKQNSLGYTAENAANKGVAGGYAPLGPDGKVSSNYLPADGSYKGTYNATTNTPAISTGVGTSGDFYFVGVGGTVTADSVGAVNPGDQLRFNGTKWERIPSYTAVSSVAGKTGAVTLAVADLTDSTATGRSLVTATDAAAARTTLGLGSLATKSTVATADITNSNVTNAKLANMAALTIKGNNSSTTAGAPSDLTMAQVKTMLALGTVDVSGLDTALGNKLDASAYTAADILTKLKTVDGSGSGLDADLLDGKSSAEFGPSNNKAAGSNLNAAALTNIAFDGDNLVNAPDASWWTYLTVSHRGGNTVSMAIANKNNSQDLRVGWANDLAANEQNRSWTWNKLWHQGNDGSGSGLDADVLRGVTPTSFGLSLLDDADAAAARTTLGLGTAATQASTAFAAAVHGHSVATTSVDGFMSAGDKTKLDGIAANANNYAHPTGDGNLHVPATGTASNGKFLKAGSTAGSLSWTQVAWGDISGKPTTLSGYGITDAYSSNTVDTLLAGKQNSLGYTAENTSNKGVANGYAGLDANGKVPTSQMPADVLGNLAYKGTWNASTNTPAIPAASAANKGHYYIVSVAGATNIPGGGNDWQIGDWLVSDGTDWDKIDNTDKVSSVNSKTGAVSLVASDVGAQPADATLTALAGVTTAADRLIYATGVDAFAVTPLTAAARSLLDDTTVTAMRTTLGAAAGSDAQLLLDETETPATPAANKVVIYAKADGKIYKKDDTGVEKSVGGGPSLGEDSIIRTNAKTITTNIAFTGSENGMSAGPIEIAVGVTVDIPAGSTWSIV